MAYIVKNGVYYCSTEAKHIYCEDNWGFAETDADRNVEKAIDKILEYNELKNRNFNFAPAPIPGNTVYTHPSGSQYSLESFISDFQIKAGKFKKSDGTQLCVGNYFTIIDGIYNKTWIIVGIDTELYKGSGTQFNDHHITVMPMSPLAAEKFNDENGKGASTVGGYYNSDMHHRLNEKANLMLSTGTGGGAYNHFLLSHPVQLNNTNTRNSDGLTSTIWTTAYLVLPTEVQIRGTNYTIGRDWNLNGEATMKFPLFRFASFKSLITTTETAGNSMWLRSVYYDINSDSNTATNEYALIHQLGYPWHRVAWANNNGALAGVFPYMLLGDDR